MTTLVSSRTRRSSSTDLWNQVQSSLSFTLSSNFFTGDFRPGKLRVISIARLNASRQLHLRPINVLVLNDPIRRSNLGEGFVLRCFQHLSRPDAATRQCTWRYNRLTGGLSNTVLSY